MTGAPPGAVFNLRSNAMKVGADVADFDLTRSGAVAITLAPDAEEPGMTMILPVKDEKGIGAKLKAKNPGAVVTEYAWTATPTAVQQGIYGVTCDPCPTEIPIDGDMMRFTNVASHVKYDCTKIFHWQSIRL